jgi:hypothetical protein
MPPKTKGAKGTLKLVVPPPPEVVIRIEPP